MGDPAGVGPEVCLDLLTNPEIGAFCAPIVFGDLEVMKKCAGQTGKTMPRNIYLEDELPTVVEPGVFHIESLPFNDFEPCRISPATGQAGYDYIIKAIDLAMAGVVDGVATAPINKEALRSAGIPHPGHTEIFAERTGVDRFCMLQVSDEVTASFVTVHCGYHEVPDLLTVERIVEVIELTRDALQRIRGHEPRMVVCGLNPHAGEHGLFGNLEEERIIIPAMERAAAGGAILEGPLPSDTAFIPAKRAVTDAFICMYHDQGHIPLKALAFDEAVNTTLGLPIIRTSVDHGTALDIAWQGKANPQSLIEAVTLAAKLC